MIRILVGGPERERAPLTLKEQVLFGRIAQESTTVAGRRMIEWWATTDRVADPVTNARLTETFLLMWRTTIDGKTGQQHG